MKAFFVLLLGASTAWGDGGAVLFSGTAGPYLVTLFGSPVPLRAGAADFSVLVQNASRRAPVLDANVVLRLSKAGQRAIVARASRSAATNKLLYAATLQLPSAGEWQMQVDSNGIGVTGAVIVLPEQPQWIAYWPYFAIVPTAIALFAINQWLKAKRRVRNLQAPP